MKHASPLIWICAAAAALLSAVVLLDPAGSYAAYRTALPGGTPALAAFFTAAQDGVLPWTGAPSAPADLPDVPQPDLSRPDVSAPDDPAPADSMPVDPVPTDPIPEDPAPDVDAQPLSFVPVEADYFDDALFIGDSRIEGLSLYGRLPNAVFYWQRGMSVWSALEKECVEEGREKLTVPEALTRHRFGKIYLMFGVNELGKGTTRSFAEQYGEVVASIRALQPDALIYVQSILHVTREKSGTSIYRNDLIDERNAAIALLADGEHVFYLDCNPAFDGEDGALIPDYTGDGVHLMAPYYALWRDWLLGHAIVK